VRLRVAFLNCHDLYAPGGHPTRGPRTQAGLDAKVAALAEGLCGLFAPELPHVVGLCEVGDLGAVEALAEALSPGQYGCHWSGPPRLGPRGPETALALMAHLQDIQVLGLPLGARLPPVRRRAYWHPWRLELRKRRSGPIWAVVGHWKAGSGPDNESERDETSRQVVQFLREQQVAECGTPAAVLMGDLNAEPWSPSLQGDSERRVKSVRIHDLVMGTRAPGALYGLMWRWAGEPEPWPTGGTRSRPVATFHPARGTPRLLLDHFLVSWRCLRKGPVTLDEASLRAIEVGHSDHVAVGVELAY
jgi:hypothetical protein